MPSNAADPTAERCNEGDLHVQDTLNEEGRCREVKRVHGFSCKNRGEEKVFKSGELPGRELGRWNEVVGAGWKLFEYTFLA